MAAKPPGAERVGSRWGGCGGCKAHLTLPLRGPLPLPPSGRRGSASTSRFTLGIRLKGERGGERFSAGGGKGTAPPAAGCRWGRGRKPSRELGASEGFAVNWNIDLRGSAHFMIWPRISPPPL